MRRMTPKAGLLAFVGLVLLGLPLRGADDPLPSWNEGPSKRAILDFIAGVAKEGSPGFVRATDRIAVFDNDGTLWCEQPAYVQALFVRDRVRAMAPEHPEWRETQPFKALLEGDRKGLAELGERGLVDLVMATHAGMTADDFALLVVLLHEGAGPIGGFDVDGLGPVASPPGEGLRRRDRSPARGASRARLRRAGVRPAPAARRPRPALGLAVGSLVQILALVTSITPLTRQKTPESDCRVSQSASST